MSYHASFKTSIVSFDTFCFLKYLIFILNVLLRLETIKKKESEKYPTFDFLSGSRTST